MKKNEKGTYGYLNRQKKREVLKTTLFFGMSLAVFLTGYLTAGTKNNLLTIVAILGCLPACKSLVETIMYFKAQGCRKEAYEAISAHAGTRQVLYDLYLTSYDKNYQIESLSIRDKTICGYVSSEKCDIAGAQKHIGSILTQNGYKQFTIKLYTDLDKYITWLECDLEASENVTETSENGREILRLICNISL